MRNKLQLEYKPVQLILPVNYEHIIDNCDPVVSFKEVVGGLNLSKFIKTSSKGRHDYNSETMLHIILFAYMENIRSLRDIEKACKTDIRFMYLSNSIKPSFMAFQRFIDSKLKESIDDIFYTINNFLIEKEKINTDTLYVDGTKIEANAHKFSFVWKKAILNYQEKLYKKISKKIESINNYLNLNFNTYETYESYELLEIESYLWSEICKGKIEFKYGKGSRKHPLQRHYEAISEYIEKLTEYKNHLDICGQRNSYSKTDHDATFMHGKEDYYNKTGIFKPYYNIQIGVSDEYILHYGVYPNPTDTKTWIPFFDSYYSKYKKLPLNPVADAGYGSYDNYMYNLNNGMNLTMKYGTFSKEDESSFKKKLYNIKNMEVIDDILISSDNQRYIYSHEYINRKGIYPQIKQVYCHESWDESMKEEGIPKQISRDIVLLQLQKEAKRILKTEEGVHLRTRRSVEVEGAFGELKSNSNYTRIHRRGKERVQTEICLELIGYNLRKYHSKKHRVIH